MKKPALSALCSIALALILSIAMLGAAPAHAGDPARKSERWLVKQLDDGVVHNDQFDFDDYGLSVDVGFALASMSAKGADLRPIRKALAKNIESYISYEGDLYAGSIAKATAFAQQTGANPKRFGGVNLVKLLNRRLAKKGPIAGRLQDKGAGDYANVIGQAYAVQALTAAKKKKAGKATKFLLAQQCKRGYFRLNFTEDKGAADQTCDGGKRKTTSAPDTDVTALAVLALLRDPKPTKAVRKAINRATTWLAKTQAKNGSFGGGPSTQKPNANSTGLAASALGSAGVCARASKAAKWLTKLVVSGVRGEKGAIAYDKSALAGAKDGISVEERDQFIRATAQAAPALVYTIVDGCD